VTTSQDSKFELGSFRCYGCGAHGKWNKLAEALGLRQIGQDDNVFSEVFTYDPEFFSRLTADTKFRSYDSVLEDLGLTDPTALPEKGEWRTLPNSFLAELGICSVKHKKFKTQYLFMPAYMKGKVVGGIRAAMTSKAKIKYKNSPGDWSKGKGLYPYDFTAKMVDDFANQQGFRAVLLVEGARDAACACIEGFPALGILGTQSWCDEKLSNLLDLDPDLVMECFDGDVAGREAAKAIVPKIRRFVPVISANLSDAAEWLGEEKLDPGNAPEKVFKRMWTALLERRSATYPKPKG
jgi:hypothetical protein